MNVALYEMCSFCIFLNSLANNIRGKKSQNVRLSSGQVPRVNLNFYLSCCQITLVIQENITLHCNLYLPVGHWMKIYAFPDSNFTCRGL